MTPTTTTVSRFAPSPTGDLHLGHAFAAIYAHDLAACGGGRFIVRVEDLDAGRCREDFIVRNLDDLAWLGLRWEQPVVRQSERMAFYAKALARLDALGVTYPCFCTRREIADEVAAAVGAPHALAPDGSFRYPGTCRKLGGTERRRRIAAGQPCALRLDMARAVAMTGPLAWTDRVRGPQAAAPERFGDVVLARKDVAASYHLAVVVDDAEQQVTEVTRGEDLFEASHIHRLLYALLDLAPPVWHHHVLCRDATGRRLAKRDGDTTIRALRAAGHGPGAVRAMATAMTAAFGDGSRSGASPVSSSARQRARVPAPS
ncbi:MAG: tRNA glutamyl-Q(34) synthetase GluQRS [Rhodospirillales bacterium]|nr:tRNA glutamyl-Q(34) synthetase GluQRS [Rhodospirillales bacterium]